MGRKRMMSESLKVQKNCKESYELLVRINEDVSRVSDHYQHFQMLGKLQSPRCGQVLDRKSEDTGSQLFPLPEPG